MIEKILKIIGVIDDGVDTIEIDDAPKGTFEINTSFGSYKVRFDFYLILGLYDPKTTLLYWLA